MDFNIVNFRKVILNEVLRTHEFKPVSVEAQYHSSSFSKVSLPMMPLHFVKILTRNFLSLFSIR
jgi:hypothetical protein